MNECQMQANWRQVGTAIHRLPPFVYHVPILLDHNIIEHLGSVKERTDGRWNWWRKRSQFHKDWNGEGQGVTGTKELAQKRVLEGWDDSESQN